MIIISMNFKCLPDGSPDDMLHMIWFIWLEAYLSHEPYDMAHTV